MSEIVRFAKKYLPGFKNAYLQSTAPQVGVRETRRIMGDYVLSTDDLLSLKEFPDRICRGCFKIDVHNPTGTGIEQIEIPKGQSYTIPYRSLLVRGKDNLIMGCRAISSTHKAHSAIRVQPIVMAMGQAAGTAAALSVEKGANLRDISKTELQDTLVKANVVL